MKTLIAVLLTTFVSHSFAQSLSEEFRERGEEARARDVAQRRARANSGMIQAVQEQAHSRIAGQPEAENQEANQIVTYYYHMANGLICSIAVHDSGRPTEVPYVFYNSLSCR